MAMTEDQLVQMQPTLLQIAGGDEDVLQTANLKLWEKRAVIRNPSHYGLRVACRARWKKLRPSKIALSIDSDEVHRNVVSPTQSPLDLLCSHEDFERVRTAILRLSPRQQTAISPASINSERSAHSARHKALRNLRQILQVRFSK